MSRQFSEIRPPGEHDPQRVRWFLMANGYQPPRSARIMIKWTF